MNKLQKRLVVFLLILSLCLFLTMYRAGKMVMGKKEEIAGLSLKVTSLTKEGQDLKEKFEGKEKESAQLKLDLEDLRYELNEEKKRVESFQSKYKAEKAKGDGLKANLDSLKLSLEEEKKTREKLAVETEKLKEEKELLSRDLNEMKLAKETLEAFVSEEKGEPVTAKSIVTPLITNGKIVTIYPQGLLGVELEKSPQDKANLGKIVKEGRAIEISNIHSHMIILEVDEGEDLTGFKKGDDIKYLR